MLKESQPCGSSYAKLIPIAAMSVEDFSHDHLGIALLIAQRPGAAENPLERGLALLVR
jgi:hypothetical protein